MRVLKNKMTVFFVCFLCALMLQDHKIAKDCIMCAVLFINYHKAFNTFKRKTIVVVVKTHICVDASLELNQN